MAILPGLRERQRLSPGTAVTAVDPRAARRPGEALAGFGRQVSRFAQQSDQVIRRIQENNNKLQEVEDVQEIEKLSDDEMKEIKAIGFAPEIARERLTKFTQKLQDEFVNTRSGQTKIRMASALGRQNILLGNELERINIENGQAEFSSRMQSIIENEGNLALSNPDVVPDFIKNIEFMFSDLDFDKNLQKEFSDKARTKILISGLKGRLLGGNLGSINTGIAALEGRSSNKKLNAAYDKLNVDDKASWLSKLRSAKKVVSKKVVSSLNKDLKTFETSALAGDGLDPKQVAALIRDIGNSPLDEKEKALKLDTIKSAVLINESMDTIRTADLSTIERIRNSTKVPVKFNAKKTKEHFAILDKFIDSNLKERSDDPAQYVWNNFSARLQPLVDQNDASPDTVSLQRAVDNELLGIQSSIGITPDKQRILTKQSASDLKEEMESNNRDPLGGVLFIEKRYGRINAQKVYRDLVRAGMSNSILAVGSLPNKTVQRNVIETGKSEALIKDTLKQLGIADKDFNEAINTNMGDVAARFGTDLDDVSLSLGLMDLVRKEAKKQVALGIETDIDKAVKNAREKIIDPNFNEIESGNSELLVPNQFNVGDKTFANKEVFLEAFLRFASKPKGFKFYNVQMPQDSNYEDGIVPAKFDPTGLTTFAGEGKFQTAKEQWFDDLKDGVRWELNSTRTGKIMKYKDPLTGLIRVVFHKDKDGAIKPLEVSFETINLDTPPPVIEESKTFLENVFEVFR